MLNCDAHIAFFFTGMLCISKFMFVLLTILCNRKWFMSIIKWIQATLNLLSNIFTLFLLFSAIIQRNSIVTQHLISQEKVHEDTFVVFYVFIIIISDETGITGHRNVLCSLNKLKQWFADIQWNMQSIFNLINIMHFLFAFHRVLPSVWLINNSVWRNQSLALKYWKFSRVHNLSHTIYVRRFSVIRAD